MTHYHLTEQSPTGATVERVLLDYEVDQLYIDHLNAVYGTVNICGQPFGAGAALAQLDIDAFYSGAEVWREEHVTLCSRPFAQCDDEEARRSA